MAGRTESPRGGPRVCRPGWQRPGWQRPGPPAGGERGRTFPPPVARRGGAVGRRGAGSEGRENFGRFKGRGKARRGAGGGIVAPPVARAHPGAPARASIRSFIRAFIRVFIRVFIRGGEVLQEGRKAYERGRGREDFLSLPSLSEAFCRISVPGRALCACGYVCVYACEREPFLPRLYSVSFFSRPPHA